MFSMSNYRVSLSLSVHKTLFSVLHMNVFRCASNNWCCMLLCVVYSVSQGYSFFGGGGERLWFYWSEGERVKGTGFDGSTNITESLTYGKNGVIIDWECACQKAGFVWNYHSCVITYRSSRNSILERFSRESHRVYQFYQNRPASAVDKVVYLGCWHIITTFYFVKQIDAHVSFHNKTSSAKN
jgi:hypothetical protein